MYIFVSMDLIVTFHNAKEQESMSCERQSSRLFALALFFAKGARGMLYSILQKKKYHIKIENLLPFEIVKMSNIEIFQKSRR